MAGYLKRSHRRKMTIFGGNTNNLQSNMIIFECDINSIHVSLDSIDITSKDSHVTLEDINITSKNNHVTFDDIDITSKDCHATLDSHSRRADFYGSSHTSDFKIGTPMASLPGARRYRVGAGTGWASVNIL